jgi:hypothetical protein
VDPARDGDAAEAKVEARLPDKELDAARAVATGKEEGVEQRKMTAERVRPTSRPTVDAAAVEGRGQA